MLLKKLSAIFFISIFLFCCEEPIKYGKYTLINGYLSASYSSAKNLVLPKIIKLKADSTWLEIVQTPDHTDFTKDILASSLHGKYQAFEEWREHPTLNDSDQAVRLYKNEVRNYEALALVFQSRGCPLTYNEKAESVAIKISDSILKNDPKFLKMFSLENCYWIISLKSDSLYGPLSKSEFNFTRKLLRIPFNIE